ncbi:MAG: hypothetical protein H6719_33135 [Sandaracinaceae bacterium]|nr:hypothetical protein [Sandaracinaceae bacterium]
MRHLLLVIAGSSFLWLAGCAGSPEDIGAATENICCGSNCCCPSLGTGGPIGPGDLNPANSCEVCDPSTSQTSWTPVSGCMAGTDAGPGMTGTDAGSGSGGGGGGCSVGATAPATGGLALLGFAAALLFGRRRR